MSAVLAAHHLVRLGRVGAAVRTEAGELERADVLVLDMSSLAVGPKRTEASGVMRAGWTAQV